MVLGGGSDSTSEEVCNIKPFMSLNSKASFVSEVKILFQKEEKVSEFSKHVPPITVHLTESLP